MPIDAGQAQEYLKSNLEWDAEPVLSQIQQLRLSKYARAIDATGLSPDATGYELTYSFNSLHAAIYLGWTWKLAAAVELHEDDENEIFDHCKQMVAHWGGIVEGIAIGGTLSGSGSTAIPNLAVW